MDHELKRIPEGTGNMGTITPTCSCGWVGFGVAAYNDDQYFQIQRQEQAHLRDVAPGDLTADAQANGEYA